MVFSICSAFRGLKEQLLLNVHTLFLMSSRMMCLLMLFLSGKFIRISSTMSLPVYITLSLQSTYLIPFSAPNSWSSEVLSLCPTASHRQIPWTSTLLHRSNLIFHKTWTVPAVLSRSTRRGRHLLFPLL